MRTTQCSAEGGEISVNVHAGERFDSSPTGRVIAQVVSQLGAEKLIVKFTRTEALAFAAALTEAANTIVECKHCGEVLFPDSPEQEGEWIDTAWGEAICWPHDETAKRHEVEA